MQTTRHILLVEDEDNIAEIQQAYLERENYRVTRANSGEQAIQLFSRQLYSLVILDLMLPGIDGLGVCRNIRKHSDVPIIMITAKIEEMDRLMGLELGADDYICKPFSPREMVARVKVLFRRIPDAKQSLYLDNLIINKVDAEVLVEARVLELTRKEYLLLDCFSQNIGRLMSREQIITYISPNEDINDRSIDAHIKNLRKKLSLHAPDKTWIKTIYGMGYKFDI